MGKIEGCGALYGAQRGLNKLRSGNEKEIWSAKKTEKEEKDGRTASLSQDAEKLLEELKEKYSDTDFIVADYDSDSEAQEYLQRGTKEYSVLIEPELLEKMAADDAEREKYLNIIDNATAQLDDAVEQLGDDADNVRSIGISVGKDGGITFFADLEKMSEKQRERIEKQREEKGREGKKTDHCAEITSKKAFVKAGAAEELVEKIKNIDWNRIRETEEDFRGSRFDVSV